MTAAAVAGKTIVLATTNGTPALVATQGGDPVLVGAPANFKAVAERARAILAQRGDVVIVCGGRDKQFALEDAYTAGRLIKAIRKGIRKLVLNDAARATVALIDQFAGWQEALERSEAAQQLVDADLGERSEEHTSELQSHSDLVCRLLLEKKKKKNKTKTKRKTINECIMSSTQTS